MNGTYLLFLATKTNGEPTGKTIDLEPLPAGTTSEHFLFTVSVLKETGIVSVFSERTGTLLEMHKKDLPVLIAALHDLDQWEQHS
ncbi:MAG: hypothetical protein KKI15_02780 [Proteobacteria bacterium]|nr:hypothetical protein [Pseudomonadota bacterium]